MHLPQATIAAGDFVPGSTGRVPTSFSAPFSAASATIARLNTVIGTATNFMIVFIVYIFLFLWFWRPLPTAPYP